MQHYRSFLVCLGILTAVMGWALDVMFLFLRKGKSWIRNPKDYVNKDGEAQPGIKHLKLLSRDYLVT